MPQPGSRRAAEVLSHEGKVFCEFFQPGPPDLAYEGGIEGVWVSTSSVGAWRGQTPEKVRETCHGLVTPKMSAAKRNQHLAKLDESVAAALRDERDLHPRAFEKGSLLSEHYRVLVGGGESIEGRGFTGEIKKPLPSMLKGGKEAAAPPAKKQKVPFTPLPALTSVVALDAPPFK